MPPTLLYLLHCAGSGVAGVLPNGGAAEVKVTLTAMDAVLTKVLALCAKPETIVVGESRLSLNNTFFSFLEYCVCCLILSALTLCDTVFVLYGAGTVGEAVVEAVWKEYGPFLKSHATTLTPPQALSSLAASLTLCLSQKVLGQAPSNKEAASSLFHYFLTHENVNPG